MPESAALQDTSVLNRIRPQEIVVIVCTLVGWCVLFTAGFVVNSAPYRDALTSTATLSIFQTVKDWFVVITTFTLTNVALLCCLASLLGAAGRRLRLGLTQEEKDSSVEAPNPYAAGVIAGFFVYLVAISGILVLIEAPFSALSPERYTRLAGLISLLSFLVGFSPRMLSQFLARIAEIIEGAARQPSR